MSGTQAMQEALEEKQQHIESLLQERDQERNEMMEVNMSAAEKQAQINQLQELYDNVSRLWFHIVWEADITEYRLSIASVYPTLYVLFGFQCIYSTVGRNKRYRCILPQRITISLRALDTWR